MTFQAGDNNHFHPTCARCTKCGEPFGDGEEMFLQGAAIWHPRCGPGPNAPEGDSNSHYFINGFDTSATDPHMIVDRHEHPSIEPNLAFLSATGLSYLHWNFGQLVCHFLSHVGLFVQSVKKFMIPLSFFYFLKSHNVTARGLGQNLFQSCLKLRIISL